MIVIIIIGLIIILTAVWNGLVIKWGLSQDKQKVANISRYWHMVGFIIRGLLVALVYLLSFDWYYTSGAAFLCWLPYNMIINKINKWGWFYIGRTSIIDKLIRKILNLK